MKFLAVSIFVMMIAVAGSISAKTWVCEEDSRAGDGPLRRLTLTEGEGGKYAFSFTRIQHLGDDAQDTTETLELGSGLTCDFSKNDERLATCSRVDQVAENGNSTTVYYRLTTFRSQTTMVNSYTKEDETLKNLGIILVSPKIVKGQSPLLSEADTYSFFRFSDSWPIKCGMQP